MKRVYFIKPIGFDGPIKIGNSCNPTGRINSLELWCPFPLEVLASTPGGLELERRFHARFYEQHIRHEWFNASPELASVIAAINAGTFDVECLPAGRSLQRSARAGGRGKWTDEEKAAVLLRNAVKRAEKSSGLVLDYPHSKERSEAFVANPCRATGGVSEAVRERRAQRRVEAYHRKLARAAA